MTPGAAAMSDPALIACAIISASGFLLCLIIEWTPREQKIET
jgi:hypothetical protein